MRLNFLKFLYIEYVLTTILRKHDSSKIEYGNIMSLRVKNLHAVSNYEFFVMHDISVGVINILFMSSALWVYFATVDLFRHFDKIQ